MGRGRAVLIWAALGLAIFVPLSFAATSPLLAWRQPVYVISGFAGVVALALMLLQPLLAAGLLPGLPPPRSRVVHRWFGAGLVTALVLHVGGLWITSPPDVVDVLLFRSPTPFAIWGVVAMWTLLAAALLALLRRRWRVPPRIWRRAHAGLVAVSVPATAIHALLIEGTMEGVSKAVLCLLAVLATGKAAADIWLPRSSSSTR